MTVAGVGTAGVINVVDGVSCDPFGLLPPCLSRPCVLLFKSKNTSGRERSKDQADFEKVRDALEPERRAWLRWALLLADPAHPWIAELV